jgi:hypothetical protein
MINEDAYLKFTNEYLEWKRQKQMEYEKFTPEDFMEEVILKEKSEAYDMIWDLFADGNANLDKIEQIVKRANDTV